MKTNDIMARIVFCIKNGVNFLLVGSPGIGKTKIIIESANLAGIKPENVIFVHASIKSPTDFSGLPFRLDNEKASFLPYGDLFRMLNATEPTLVFFDDLGQGSSLVQSAIMQLIEERCIGDKKVSPFVSFVLATNKTTDGAGVSKVLEPLKGRTAIYQMEVCAESWINWAMMKGINPLIISFIKTYPDYLHVFEPSSLIENYASPRNYERLDKFVSQTDFPLDVSDCIACVGQKVGIQFFNHFKTSNSISHIPKQIFTDWKTAEHVTGGNRFTLLTALGSYFTKVNKEGKQVQNEKQFDSFINYLNAMGESELQRWIVEFIISKNKFYINTKTYLNWSAAA
jgi:hypothetical protein